MPDLLAHGLADLFHAIGDAVHALVIIRAGFGDANEATCQHETRAAEQTCLKGAAHGKLKLVPAAQVADRGDPRGKILAGVAQDLQGHRTVVHFELTIRFAAAGEMDVAIDEPGQNIFTGEIKIEDVFFQGGQPLFGFAGIDNAAIAHSDRGIRQRLTASAVDESLCSGRRSMYSSDLPLSVYIE